MADFDDRGFAAVNAFFGHSGATASQSDPRANTDVSSTAALSTAAHRNRRQGVGAIASTTETKAAAHVAKRVLQVGNKRKHDDDEEDLAVHAKLEYESGDDEEDRGRTAIESKAVVASTALAVTAKKIAQGAGSKKKKKGKRERQQQVLDGSTPQDKVAETVKSDDQGPNVSVALGDEHNAENSDNKGKKRKRTKVRSRQKNIYKDKREHKPEHLVPGNKEYQGRPLSEATRTKLQLPPSKAAQNVSTLRSHWNQDDDTGGPDMDTKPLAAELTVNESKLDQPHPTRPKRMKDPNKRPKYKNLL